MKRRAQQAGRASITTSATGGGVRYALSHYPHVGRRRDGRGLSRARSELGIEVAIKTIRPGASVHASAALDAERRFKRELLLARQVTHPNVVRIYDLGEINRTKYITMSYVAGQNLATILEQEGILPVRRVLDIMRQVVAGMCAAHATGIVHRDLKPANIMIESGHALIMDFGIARSVTAPPTPSALRSRQPGPLNSNTVRRRSRWQGQSLGHWTTWRRNKERLRQWTSARTCTPSA